MSGERRRWLELAVRSPSAGERQALLAEGLLALGGTAAEERDGWFVTYLPEPGDPTAFARRASVTLEELTGVAGIEVRTGWRADEDWTETWKRGLGARRVTERIEVRPSWVESAGTPRAEIVVVIDPGMAFGTAEHGTTRGCLRLLDRVVSEGDRTLDVGSGSGILAIAMARLGAREVVAAECDPLAYETLVENVERNGVGQRVRCVHALVDTAWLSGRGPFDGVAANLQSGILEPLVPGLFGALRPGGWLIVSGILDQQWRAASALLEREGFAPGDLDADGEWRSGLFRRAAAPDHAGLTPLAGPPRGGSRAP